MDRDRDELITFSSDVGMFSPQAGHMDSWYKGEHFNLLPPSKSALSADRFAEVLVGWKPKAPLIHPDTRVMALGSCFASYFILWLGDNGFNQNAKASPYNMLIRQRAAFENAWVIAQQFRWAFGEFDSSQALWIDQEKQVVESSTERALEVRQSLEDTDILIITLGLSEVWYDKTNNEPLWRAIPLRYFNPNRHAFKVLTVADTIDCLRTIERIRAAHLRDLKIIYTVSPVRLHATFRPVSALTANNVSKAIIRAALDEFFRSDEAGLNDTSFYFPSYEIVMEGFGDPYDTDNQHVHPTVVRRVLRAFAEHYTSLASNIEEAASDDSSAAAELYERLTALEERNRELQQTCDERLRVIEELDAAARARLELIRQLSAG